MTATGDEKKTTTITDAPNARCGVVVRGRACNVEIVRVGDQWLHCMPQPLVGPSDYPRRASIEAWTQALHDYIELTQTHLARPAVIA